MVMSNKKGRGLEECFSPKKSIFSEKFVIKKIHGGIYSASFTPIDEVMVGGLSPSYKGSSFPAFLFEVSPLNSNIPIKFLKFFGYCHVHPETKITAYISRPIVKFRYIQKKERIVYFYKPLSEKETAIKIEIQSSNGSVLEDYTCRNYEEECAKLKPRKI